MSLPNERELAPVVVDRFAQQRGALDSLDTVQLDRHAAVFAQVHADLQAALAEIDNL